MLSVRKGGFALVAVVAGLLPSPASACICSTDQGPRSRLAAAHGAFIGTLERTEDYMTDEGRPERTFHYRVERSVKGDIGATVVVRGTSNEGTCGMSDKIGERVGRFLYGSQRGWRSSSCDSLSPERMLEAAAPLPMPNGIGPPAYVVGTNLGEYRSMLLDAQGRTLSYGPGEGTVFELDMCPGNTRVIEAISYIQRRQDPPILAVRRIAGFALEREIRAHDVPGMMDLSHVSSLQCRDEAATHIDVALYGATSRVLRHKDGVWNTIWSGTASRIVLADGAPMALLVQSDRIERLDLDTGSVTLLHREDSIRSVTIAPNGRFVAVDARRWDEPARLSLIDMRSGTVRARTQLDTADGGVAAWLDDDTLLVVMQVESRLELFNRRLQRVGAVDRWTYRLHVAGGRAFGVAFEPPMRVMRAAVRSGKVEPFTTLPDGPVLAIAAVEQQPPPVTPTTTSSTSTTTTTAVAPTVPQVTETPPPPSPEAAALPLVPAGTEPRPLAMSLLALVMLVTAAAGFFRLRVPGAETSGRRGPAE